MANQEKVKIDIVNINGSPVANLFNGHLTKDRFIWNGRSINGELAPTGIYFFRMKIGSKETTQKFVLLR